jgi:hypothetical protein
MKSSRELLGERVRDRIRDHQDVLAHRLPGARLAGKIVRPNLVDLRYVVCTVRGQQPEHCVFGQVGVGAAQESSDSWALAVMAFTAFSWLIFE